MSAAQAYAWFVPYMLFSHRYFGPMHGGGDMGLDSIVPAWIWALLVSATTSFIFYYKTQRFPWSNLIVVGLIPVPVAVGVMFLRLDMEVVSILFRFGGLIPAGRKGWEPFDVTALVLMLVSGYFILRHSYPEKRETA